MDMQVSKTPYLTTLNTGFAEDPRFVHAPQDQRIAMGEGVACYVKMIVADANPEDEGDKPVCPGCWMAIIHNAVVKLAEESGTPLSTVESWLGASLRMAAVYQKVAHAEQH